jgi:5-methylcytosine-specific restriction endonuclease McrA
MRNSKPQIAGARNPNWKGGSRAVKCQQCRARFLVPPHRVGKARFCSMRCVGLAQRGDRARVPPRAQVEKRCAECGKPFRVCRAEARRTSRCSMACQGRWRARVLSGEKNPNWRGGTSTEPYPFVWKEVRQRVIARDGGRCRSPLCWGTSTRINVHHIDHDKSNCADANLITLCASCNGRANFNRPDWVRLYSGMV